ncbi:Flavin-linked sulfhydryl oxidase of the mitochondrial IMS [Naganishia albida]|nr:Flavin-linked sulfhydryl oxidase of the mitochondrial IMS [Naganishia albida]
MSSPPALPRGTILDPAGHPVKVCIPWQTWRQLLRNADAPQNSRQSAPGNVPQSVTTRPDVIPAPVAMASKKSRFPPGVVLDENGKPCKVCNSWQTWAKVAKKQTTPNTKSTTVGSTLGAAAMTTAPESKPNVEHETKTRPDDCPPDVEALGRATWTFLHTTAAYYPRHPTPTQQTHMRSLIHSLAEFYPCTWCAKDFRERIAEAPPDVAGREGLSRWMCERHNEVNERLGKEVFDCGKVMERWKDGPEDGRCD